MNIFLFLLAALCNYSMHAAEQVSSIDSRELLDDFVMVTKEDLEPGTPVSVDLEKFIILPEELGLFLLNDKRLVDRVEPDIKKYRSCETQTDVTGEEITKALACYGHISPELVDFLIEERQSTPLTKSNLEMKDHREVFDDVGMERTREWVQSRSCSTGEDQLPADEKKGIIEGIKADWREIKASIVGLRAYLFRRSK